MYIIKASGKKEEFSRKKIEGTCLRAGASRQLAKEVANKVAKKVYNGMQTREILKLALDLLRKDPDVAARYKLKEAIMKLGPAGFLFEKFIGAVLKNHGYKTKVDQILRGKKVNQEVDVIAKLKKTYMVECKYHNKPGIHSDLKVAMYTYARFLDLKKYFDQPWLITNTKCTPTAFRYAKGVNLEITSWHYPKGKSLRDLIEKKKLYPITMLNSVRGDIKYKLIKANIILAKDLLEKRGIPKNIIEEAHKLLYH